MTMDIIFHDTIHKQLFFSLYRRMKITDVYHQTMAYLLALDTVCREHTTDIFDFEESCILPECLTKGWQTSTSMRTCRLAFNLWNGYCCSERDEITASIYYSPYYLFDTNYASYYWQAIKIRYPEYTPDYIGV